MIDITKPLQKGNAIIINELCRPIIPLYMLRLSAIADFYTEEPQKIRAKITKDESYKEFEQIFRFRKWVPNNKTESWIIYSNNREKDDEISYFLLRHVIWDKRYNIKNMNRDEKYECYPKLENNNVYLGANLNLMKDIEIIDNIIGNGIRIERNANKADDSLWKEIEIYRLYNWGHLSSIWSSLMTNIELEDCLEKLENRFKEYISNDNEKIYSMELDYIYPIESYKKLIYNNS